MLSTDVIISDFFKTSDPCLGNTTCAVVVYQPPARDPRQHVPILNVIAMTLALNVAFGRSSGPVGTPMY